ncbi:uncharacterized protein LTR77_007208 [Saxophila tyrrhenica]|uniref:Xylanolytic transcriptional activator regulatory domain-containing protein n=1 Tax=Saxophila tyrrhenica TaxID=1690608 RepID=A0AAV9P711_9PEZI|nr:hypothetical protein LTR77_007208 [Saxophila tyrrhenica]
MISSAQSLQDEPGSNLEEYDASGVDDPGHLMFGPQSKARYISPVHFAMISEEINDINELLRNQQRFFVNNADDESESESEQHTHPGGLAVRLRGDRRTYGDIFPDVPAFRPQDVAVGQYARNPDVTELLRALPSQHQCAGLIRAYLAGYHSVSPLFHSPSFWQQAREFFQSNQVEHTENDTSIHFLALLLAVLFAGTVVSPRSYVRTMFGNDAVREELSARLYRTAVRGIRMSDFPRVPSIQSFTAFIIVDATWLRAEQPLTCCSFVGLAVRVAQMLGLHEDPSKFPVIDRIETHVRRQLFWHLVSLDCQVALASGLPAIIGSKLYDVSPITELSESAITSPPVEGSETIKEIGKTFVAGKFEFYRRMSDFLHLLHNDSLNESDLDRLLETIHENQTDLYARRERVATVVQDSITDGEPASGAAIFAKLTKMCLSMFAAKPFAVMYGPVRRHGLLQKLFEKEPTEYLHRFLRLTQCNDFQPWHWCWPGQHQPLYSIMALLQELEDRPFDTLAMQTRRLIDLAILMCGPQANEGILSHEDGDSDARPLHEGGAEAWVFIRRARERAWQKADLDPSILLCPASAKEIHFDGFPGQFDDIALPDHDPFEDNWLGSYPELGPDWQAFFADFPSDWNFDL